VLNDSGKFAGSASHPYRYKRKRQEKCHRKRDDCHILPSASLLLRPQSCIAAASKVRVCGKCVGLSTRS
jgi:hypothetical protein